MKVLLINGAGEILAHRECPGEVPGVTLRLKFRGCPSIACWIARLQRTKWRRDGTPAYVVPDWAEHLVRGHPREHPGKGWLALWLRPEDFRPDDDAWRGLWTKP